MFCPNCGKADQTENSYCRSCGEFLNSIKGKKKNSFGGDTPEEMIKTNLYLNLLSAIVSLALAIALYVSFYGQDALPVVYLAIGFLAAMSGWQFSTVYGGLKLKKHFTRPREDSSAENQNQIKSAQTKELLNEADFENIVPTSITENTTKTLSEKVKRSS